MKTPNLELAEVSLSSTPEAGLLNDAFWALDTVVQLAVLDKDLTTPPTDAPQGARYIVEGPATAAWALQERRVAFKTPAGWIFRTPRRGWIARVLDEGRSYEYDGTQWVPLFIDASQVVVGSSDVESELAALDTRIQDLENAGVGGGSGLTPDSPPETPDDADDEFDVGSTIDTTGARRSGATAWTWLNQGAATANVKQGALTLKLTSVGFYDLRGVEQATSGSTWKYRACFAPFYPAGNFAYVTMFARNVGNSKIVAAGPTYASGHNLYAQRLADPSTFNANITNVGFSILDPLNYPFFYLDFELTATDLVIRYSFTGHDDTFRILTTEALATYLTNAPDRIGLAVNTQNSGTDAYMHARWFRKLA